MRAIQQFFSLNYRPDEDVIIVDPPVGVPASGYRGGTLLPDGRVLLNPYRATKVAVYDPITNTITEYGNTYQPNNFGVSETSILTSDGYVIINRLTGLTSGGALFAFLRYNPLDNSVIDLPLTGVGSGSAIGRFVFESQASPTKVYTTYNATSARESDTPYSVSSPLGIILPAGGESLNIVTSQWLIVPAASPNYFRFNDITETRTLISNLSSTTGNLDIESSTKLSDGRILIFAHVAGNFTNVDPVFYNYPADTITNSGISFSGIARAVELVSGNIVVKAPLRDADREFQIKDCSTSGAATTIFTMPNDEVINTNNIFNDAVKTLNWIVFIPFGAKFVYQYELSTGNLFRTIEVSNPNLGAYFNAVRLSALDDKLLFVPNNAPLIVYDAATIPKTQVYP